MRPRSPPKIINLCHVYGEFYIESVSFQTSLCASCGERGRAGGVPTLTLEVSTNFAKVFTKFGEDAYK